MFISNWFDIFFSSLPRGTLIIGPAFDEKVFIWGFTTAALQICGAYPNMATPSPPIIGPLTFNLEFLGALWYP